jgi:hypothetical protein
VLILQRRIILVVPRHCGFDRQSNYKVACDTCCKRVVHATGNWSSSQLLGLASWLAVGGLINCGETPWSGKPARRCPTWRLLAACTATTLMLANTAMCHMGL